MQPKVSADQIIRFGEFDDRVKSGELRKNGQVVRTPPQPFKVSHSWLYTPGKPSRARRFSKLFGKTGPFVDFEHGLNFCIKQIRSALGDGRAVATSG